MPQLDTWERLERERKAKNRFKQRALAAEAKAQDAEKRFRNLNELHVSMLPTSDHPIIAIRVPLPPGSAAFEGYEAAAQELVKALQEHRPDAVAILLDPKVSLGMLSEDDMRAAGWVRADT